MKGWNKLFDEPESFVGRILTIHLQVGKLPETSELIFWEVCIEAFVCFRFHYRKVTCAFTYFTVTCARMRNAKQNTKSS